MSDEALRDLLAEVAERVSPADLLPRVEAALHRKKTCQRVAACTAGVLLVAAMSYGGIVVASAAHNKRAVLAHATTPPLASGATVTTSLQVGLVRLAAGSAFGPAAQQAGDICAGRGCNPIVWQSVNGSPWRVVLEVAATGSIADEKLFESSSETFLFNSDEGTQLWVSLDEGTRWSHQPLPREMASRVVTSIAGAGGAVTVTMQDSHGRTSVFAAADGSHWQGEPS